MPDRSDMPPIPDRLSDAQLRALQAHARRALENFDANRGARKGESIWHTPGSRVTEGWTPDDLSALEAWGLILVREEWKDNFVQVTRSGYATLKADGRVTDASLVDALPDHVDRWLQPDGERAGEVVVVLADAAPALYKAWGKRLVEPVARALFRAAVEAEQGDVPISDRNAERLWGEAIEQDRDEYTFAACRALGLDGEGTR
jgi:hypothetical protein